MRSTSTRDWRNRLLERARAEAPDPEDQLPTEPAGHPAWEAAARRQLFDAMRSFDPQASLPEEFLVRLQGETANSAGLPVDWTPLLKPVQNMVSAAADNELKVELAGFSKGSTVLHFRTVDRKSVEELGKGGPTVEETSLSAPARKLIDLVDAVEREADLLPWLPMVGEFEKLSTELERLSLHAGFHWRARNGDVRDATLSATGMGYIKSLQEAKPSAEPLAVQGTITELRASGHVKVKTAPNKTARAWDVVVDAQQLASMKLVLGQKVQWHAEATKMRDKLNRVTEEIVRFVGDLGTEAALPAFSNDDAWIEPTSE